MPSLMPDLVCAAQYIRMSTERQEYPPDFQKTANAAYAAAYGVELIKTYGDAGVSGLRRLADRPRCNLVNRVRLRKVATLKLAKLCYESPSLAYNQGVDDWKRS